MPAKSEKQRKFMAAARDRKAKGKPDKSDPKMGLSKFKDFMRKNKGKPSRG